jgi:hypothetical protein
MRVPGENADDRVAISVVVKISRCSDMCPQEREDGRPARLRPTRIDENIVLRPVRQVLRHAAEIDKPLLQRGEVDGIGENGRSRCSRRELGEPAGRAAAIDEIVVMIGEAVLSCHHTHEIERHIGEAADAYRLPLEVAPARDVLRGEHTEGRVGGCSRNDLDRRPVQNGAQGLIGRGLRDVERACGELLEHSHRCAGDDRVHRQIFGFVVFLLRCNVVREAERGAAGDAECDIGGSRTPGAAREQRQGRKYQCFALHHDHPAAT